MNTRKVVLVSLFLVLLGTDLQGQVPPCNNNYKDRIRIGALYMNINTREKLLEGIEAALEDRDDICIVDLKYTRVSDGLMNLRDAIKNEQVDLIIGPTESDIFVRALEEREELEPHKIPVISPLITADLKMKDTDWFFRTNVGVDQRAPVIFDYLRKYWIRSFAVLHADTEFGRRGESAFRAEIVREFGSTNNYLSEPYEPPPNVRVELAEILKKRPEAVGIFGEREDIAIIVQELDNMDEKSSAYNPLLFTILDARQLKDQVNNLYFVSVTAPETSTDSIAKDSGDEYDDVKALAYDTMTFVLGVIDELGGLPSFRTRKDFRAKFRDHFAAIMSAGSQPQGPLTGMQFSDFKNTTKPRIYEIADGQIIPVDLQEEVTSVAKLATKIGLLKRRFGFFPLFSLIAIFAVVIVTSNDDLFRWYEGDWKKLLSFPKTYLFYALKLSVAFGLYLFLSETGRIMYDDVVTAVVIALAPSALLRTNFIKIHKLYDYLLRWINRSLMMQKYRNLDTKVNIIAQYNSEIGMSSELEAIFSHARNEEQLKRNKTEVESQLKGQKDSFERRKILARQLLKRLKWDELKNKRLLPPGLKEDDDLVGPFTWIRNSFHYCLEDEDGVLRVGKVIEEQMKKHSSETKDYYDRKVNEAGENPRDRIYAQIRFLVMNFQFNEQKLRSMNLTLPESTEPDSS